MGIGGDASDLLLNGTFGEGGCSRQNQDESKTHNQTIAMAAVQIAGVFMSAIALRDTVARTGRPRKTTRKL